MKTKHSKFSYLADPIFISCIFLYAINKFIIKQLNCSSFFLSHYFNDMLLVPCCLPPLLFIIDKLNLRKKDKPPLLIEVIISLILWSIIFEVIAPFYFQYGTSDIKDIVAYWGGGLLSWLLWNKSIGKRAYYVKNSLS